MSASSSDSDGNAQDKFVFQEAISVKNKSLRMRVTVQPHFRKTIGGKTFTKLDFYRSRGIANLMCCRTRASMKQMRNGYGRRHMRKLCNALRKLRDEAFRSIVVGKSATKVKFGGAVKPLNRELQAIALQVDYVPVQAPAVPNVTDACVLTCMCGADRHNRHSELWVELTEHACHYISKVVGHYDEIANTNVDPEVEQASASHADDVGEPGESQDREMIDENVDDIHKKSPAERESIVVSDDDAPVTPCKHVTRMVGSGSGPKRSPMTLREFFSK